MYAFLVYTWYWRFIYATILIQEGSKLFVLTIRKDSFPSQGPEKKLWGRWLSRFATRHPSGTPTDQSLGAILECSWLGKEFFLLFHKKKRKLKERRVWVNQEISEEFRKEDLRWKWKEKMVRREVGWKSYEYRRGLGRETHSSFVLFQTRGRKLSSRRGTEMEGWLRGGDIACLGGGHSLLSSMQEKG